MDRAWLHLHGDLRALARRRARDGVVAVPVAQRRAVKDAVESLGVPHTEVGAVTVDDVEVDWSHRLDRGARVDVHPVTGPVPAGLTAVSYTHLTLPTNREV